MNILKEFKEYTLKKRRTLDLEFEDKIKILPDNKQMELYELIVTESIFGLRKFLHENNIEDKFATYSLYDNFADFVKFVWNKRR